METQAYIITCKTNMHAGAGSASQGVIDNLIQRDHTDNFPCIYASSLKGAFREYFEEYIKHQQGSEEEFQKTINMIFGGTAQKGSYIFHDALLISIPARSNKENFFHATCPRIIKRFIEMHNLFNLQSGLEEFCSKLIDLKDNIPWIFGYSGTDNLQIEFFSNFEKREDSSVEELFGEKFMVVSDNDFKLLTKDYNLPVIARNQLENGESKNLFYEQILPRESKFFFLVNRLNIESDFEDNLMKHIKKMPIQIGANASIGYGYCHISKYPSSKIE
jgi:CRISPR-associated protein Cmr4